MKKKSVKSFQALRLIKAYVVLKRLFLLEYYCISLVASNKVNSSKFQQSKFSLCFFIANARIDLFRSCITCFKIG